MSRVKVIVMFTLISIQYFLDKMGAGDEKVMHHSRATHDQLTEEFSMQYDTLFSYCKILSCKIIE